MYVFVSSYLEHHCFKIKIIPHSQIQWIAVYISGKTSINWIKLEKNVKVLITFFFIQWNMGIFYDYNLHSGPSGHSGCYSGHLSYLAFVNNKEGRGRGKVS